MFKFFCCALFYGILLLLFSCSTRFDTSEYLIEPGDSVEIADSMNVLVTKFHPTGTIKSEFTLYDGELMGDVYNYYKTHDTVIIYDNEGKGILATKSRLRSYYYINDKVILFQTFLSEDGEIESLKGHPVLNLDLTEKEFFVGDTLQAELRFAGLNQLKIRAYLIELSFSGDYNVVDTLEMNEDFVAKFNSQLFKMFPPQLFFLSNQRQCKFFRIFREYNCNI